jgi:hypothetical protein
MEEIAASHGRRRRRRTSPKCPRIIGQYRCYEWAAVFFISHNKKMRIKHLLVVTNG